MKSLGLKLHTKKKRSHRAEFWPHRTLASRCSVFKGLKLYLVNDGRLFSNIENLAKYKFGFLLRATVVRYACTVNRYFSLADYISRADDTEYANKRYAIARGLSCWTKRN